MVIWEVDHVYIMSNNIAFMLTAAFINDLDYLLLACVRPIAFFRTCRQSGLEAQRPKHDRVASTAGTQGRLLHMNNL